MFYYAISDIHGYYDMLKETMNLIDLKSNLENKWEEYEINKKLK